MNAANSEGRGASRLATRLKLNLYLNFIMLGYGFYKTPFYWYTVAVFYVFLLASKQILTIILD